MTDNERRALVGLSAALACRDPGALATSMGTCLKEADPRRVEEVILQSYLFLGYPAALNAFGLWRGISTREAGEAVPESWEEWSDRGREVCRIVYAGQYQDLRRNIRALHADMERWMVREGSGEAGVGPGDAGALHREPPGCPGGAPTAPFPPSRGVERRCYPGRGGGGGGGGQLLPAGGGFECAGRLGPGQEPLGPGLYRIGGGTPIRRPGGNLRDWKRRSE
jgi:hypothetical protein